MFGVSCLVSIAGMCILMLYIAYLQTCECLRAATRLRACRMHILWGSTKVYTVYRRHEVRYTIQIRYIVSCLISYRVCLLGASLEAELLLVRNDDNADYYRQKGVKAHDILAGNVPLPRDPRYREEAAALYGLLDEVSGNTPGISNSHLGIPAASSPDASKPEPS